MAGTHVRFDVTPEDFSCHLTEAVYKVALQHGFKAPFVEVELDLHQAIRDVMNRDILVSESCGSPECLAFKKESHQPWSDQGEKLFKAKEK